jgi:hypothetical protein
MSIEEYLPQVLEKEIFPILVNLLVAPLFRRGGGVTKVYVNRRGALLSQLLLGQGELVVGIPEEDEPQNGDGILRRLQLRVRPEVVCGVPKTLL